jgi:hypothetical protein
MSPANQSAQASASRGPTAAVKVVPSLATVSPEYAARLKRSEELGREHSAAVAEERRLASELASAARANEDEVAKSGLAAVLEGRIPRFRVNEDDLRAQHTEARHRIEDIVRSQRLLDQDISKKRAEASAIVCSQVQPEYKARVRALHAALLQARQAQLSLDDLTHVLNGADVAWVGTLEPLAATMLGHPNDNGSALAHWLRRARDAGYISADEIPEGLR